DPTDDLDRHEPDRVAEDGLEIRVPKRLEARATGGVGEMTGRHTIAGRFGVPPDLEKATAKGQPEVRDIGGDGCPKCVMVVPASRMIRLGVPGHDVMGEEIADVEASRTYQANSPSITR